MRLRDLSLKGYVYYCVLMCNYYIILGRAFGCDPAARSKIRLHC